MAFEVFGTISKVFKGQVVPDVRQNDFSLSVFDPHDTPTEHFADLLLIRL